MIRRSGSALALAALLLGAPAAPGEGAFRLLMFDADDCEFCARFSEEVGVIYARTAEGRAAPLERYPLEAGVPPGLRLAAPVRYTPTFVLLAGAEEVDRITGYPGEDHFWGLLAALLEARGVRLIE